MPEHPPSYPNGSGSVAAIAGHPIHPLVIPIPIGGMFFTLCADIALWMTGEAMWFEVSKWLLLITFVSGLLAGVAGAIELFGLPRARTLAIGLIHGGGNIVVLGLVALNYWLRQGWAPEQVGPGGIALTVAAVGLAGITGWLGGELAFRHGIGVSEAVGSRVSGPLR
jgi:uncharacterized membrane protein